MNSYGCLCVDFIFYLVLRIPRKRALRLTIFLRNIDIVFLCHDSAIKASFIAFPSTWLRVNYLSSVECSSLSSAISSIIS